ncbi:Hypothetical protein NocV09_01201080 [Nannochloropsis oceanica]
MVNRSISCKRSCPTDMPVPAPIPSAAALPSTFAAADATATTAASSSVIAADNDPRIRHLHDAAATLSSMALVDTNDLRAISILNEVTADGELEILLENTAPELLDAIADALDRYNAPMLHVLQAWHKKQKSALSPAFNPFGHENGHGPHVQPHPAKSNTIDRPPYAKNAKITPPWLDIAERHVTQQDPGPFVLGLLSVLRNLSYIVANEEIIARHTRILTHLVSLVPCAYQDGDSVPTGGRWPQSSGTKKVRKGNGGKIGTCVFDLLLALSSRLNVVGLVLDEHEPLAAESVPEDSLMLLAPARIRSQYIQFHNLSLEQEDFTRVVQSLLRLLMDLLTYPAAGAACAAATAGGAGNRQGVHCCLELLARLMTEHESNALLVARLASPDFLVRLHELFYVPLHGLDSMEGPGPAATLPAGKKRLRYVMLGGKKEQQQQQHQQKNGGGGEMDAEVRGLSLEVLAALCSVSIATTMEMEGETEEELREGRMEGGFRDNGNGQKDVIERLLKHVPGLVRSLILLLDVSTAASLAGRLLATLARGDDKGREALENHKRLLTYYAFRPGGEIAAKLLWSVFLAPEEEEEEEEEKEEGEE